ncbi:Inositol polyphosphate-related phosphatase [Macleaya cordata]|uniref:Inositol polyphosphate-related phosphatase n=1 Tax=Macleaya cordata TaxID=56857 RepID=A0A200Q277_MACCD|nr:Inositol polyphosphate-related phosphatase [Macleaya cordata]
MRSSDVMNTHLATHHHEGIRTVGVDKLCNFSSTGSVLSMCIVTWNMNGKVSTQLDLAKLVGGVGKFDLLVIGLQEVPRYDVARVLQEALVETHSLLGKSIMQSLQLFVFAPKNYELFITEIRVDKLAFGGLLGGMLLRRKKGAVAISMKFKGIHMVFICCHLSAHEGNVEERNSELHHISESLFSKNRNPYASPSQITVWLGDLNYRIQGLDTLPVRNLIHKNLHRLLTSKDQLLQEAERGHIFNGYCEGTLAFKPTYKYNVGSSNYDTSYKIRVPSWTDRILFKIEKYGDIEATLHSYESIDSIHSSDHKPVKAHLCLNVVDHDKLKS